MSEVRVPRAANGKVIKPQAREPDCIHSRDYSPTAPLQPASWCRHCSDPTLPEGRELAEWEARWAAWLTENPDSPEAVWVARVDRDRAAQHGATDSE
jgi:hypothetical protein